MRNILLAFFIAFIFTACDSQTKEAQVVEVVEKTSTKSSTPPTFTLTTTKGETITLEGSTQAIFSKQLENKIVLINFWATWCQPCINEMPVLVEIQEKHKDDFVILGVLFEENYDPKKLKEFMTKFNVNFPITIGKENFTMAKSFGDVQMIPESFLYTKEGLFVEKFIGEINRTKLETFIKENK